MWADCQFAELYASIDAYYTRKVRKYGTTALGVDWSCIPTQELRFAQLLKLCRRAGRFSLNDLGCGYGALLSYLHKYHRDAEVDYLGIDLSNAMIRRAKRLWRNSVDAKFVVGETSPRVADYSIASGIFNVKLDQPIDGWKLLIAKTLSDMHGFSRYGFAVNFMALGCFEDATGPGLYRAAAEPWVRYCERELGSAVKVIANYGLDEFTLLIRKY